LEDNPSPRVPPHGITFGTQSNLKGFSVSQNYDVNSTTSKGPMWSNLATIKTAVASKMVLFCFVAPEGLFRIMEGGQKMGNFL